MRGPVIGVVSFLALWGWASVPADAGVLETSSLSLRDTVTAMAEKRLSEAGPGSLVVGVIRDNRTVVVGRGDSGRPDGGPPDGRTVFHIPSGRVADVRDGGRDGYSAVWNGGTNEIVLHSMTDDVRLIETRLPSMYTHSEFDPTTWGNTTRDLGLPF